ncbi:MAG TPA: VanZ family protein [Thermoanaerobaculia bacterium]|nr:VanZ family protein [Thermoanaerobaculia bacterium]
MPLSASQSLGAARVWAAAWGIFLLALTSWPSPPRVPILSGVPHFDKLVHGMLYAVEAFLLYRSVKWPGRPRFTLSRVLVILGAMAVWGVADETHQAWIPGRSMEAGDVAADVAGAAAGALCASALSGRRPRAFSSQP